MRGSILYKLYVFVWKNDVKYTTAVRLDLIFIIHIYRNIHILLHFCRYMVNVIEFIPSFIKIINIARNIIITLDEQSALKPLLYLIYFPFMEAVRVHIYLPIGFTFLLFNLCTYVIKSPSKIL